jgi:hypothetical protein
LIPGGKQTSLLKINSFKLIFNGEVNAMKDYDVIVVGSGAGSTDDNTKPPGAAIKY